MSNRDTEVSKMAGPQQLEPRALNSSHGCSPDSRRFLPMGSYCLISLMTSYSAPKQRERGGLGRGQSVLLWSHTRSRRGSHGTLMSIGCSSSTQFHLERKEAIWVSKTSLLAQKASASGQPDLFPQT